MAKKKKSNIGQHTTIAAEIDGGGVVVNQPITQTIEQNYMPYAMSVIVSRALPEIDGFKPSHRKILYTMYKMGLLNGVRTKSANIVGQTMKLNPHGDQAIYETMVRLTRANEALLHPYIDSKGNFGKSYSRDMAYAASRYTEAKLDVICSEFFRDIEKETVDFVPNYDNQLQEPTLLPASFPSILVNSNVGIAVSMASNICPFNLKELCEATIGLIENVQFDLHQTIKGPDFPSGGYLLDDKETLNQIFDTGRGSLKIRSKYHYDKTNHCIDVVQIPPSTTIEAIMDKIVDGIRQNKIREISDIRDETDLSGLKLTIDLKRGVDADKLMMKLFSLTPLQDSFSCNFNLLIKGYPQVLGVKDILLEWISFRVQCVRRRVSFELDKKKEKLHLLLGLAIILLDIDKAISIVRETAIEKKVVSNLMKGFGIDEIQAEYVAEIKLRHLNREYILNRTKEIEQLKQDIDEMENVLRNEQKIRLLMVDDLQQVIKKYQQPRKTLLLFEHQLETIDQQELTPEYAVSLFLTKEGYFKKITPQSYRMNNEHKLKQEDEIAVRIEADNSDQLLFFTDSQQVYKTSVHEFEDSKASLLGEYIPAKLGFEENERLVEMVVTKDYTGYVLFFFEQGKVAKIPLSSYKTKTKRKKLTNAFCGKDKLVAMFTVQEDCEFLMTSTAQKVLLLHTAMLQPKMKRDSQGVGVMTLAKKHCVYSVEKYESTMLMNSKRFRPKTLPATGSVKRAQDKGEQLTL